MEDMTPFIAYCVPLLEKHHLAVVGTDSTGSRMFGLASSPPKYPEVCRSSRWAGSGGACPAAAAVHELHAVASVYGVDSLARTTARYRSRLTHSSGSCP